MKWVKIEYSLSYILSLDCQNVSKQVLLAEPKIQSEFSKPFWRLRLRRGSVGRPPSNGEGFRDIQHSMSTVLDPGVYI